MDYNKLYFEIENEVFEYIKSVFISENKKVDSEKSYRIVEPIILEKLHQKANDVNAELDNYNLDLVANFKARLNDYDYLPIIELYKKTLENDISLLLKEMSDESKHEVLKLLLFFIVLEVDLSSIREEREYLDLVRRSKDFNFFDYKKISDRFYVKNTEKRKKLYEKVTNEKWLGNSGGVPIILGGKDIPKKVVQCENKILLSQFTEKQKYYLRHIFYKYVSSKELSKIPLTQFSKLISICGNLNVEHKFANSNSKLDKTYDAVRKGLDYYSDINARENITNGLKAKLNNFNIDFLDDYL